MSSGFNTPTTPSNFESLFSAALEEYANKTGKDLRYRGSDTSFIYKIGGDSSPDSIFNVLQEKCKSFQEVRRGDIKLLLSLRPIVNVVHALSTVAVLSRPVSSARFPIVISVDLNSLFSRGFRQVWQFSRPSRAF